MAESEIEIDLYTDGACSGNPGPGGWACLLRHRPTGKESEYSGGERETTNNRMELQAVVEGLSRLKRRCRICLHSDSSYVGKGITEWMAGWKKNGWKRREKGKLVPLKNDDLWRQLDELVARHELTYQWIAGHNGHPENERCDELAVAASQRYRR
jgi:ribonuclease HI